MCRIDRIKKLGYFQICELICYMTATCAISVTEKTSLYLQVKRYGTPVLQLWNLLSMLIR